MKSIFYPNKISAKLLVDFASEIWNIESNEPDNMDNRYRFLMVYDLYIKARSYAIMNKICFCMAVIMGFAVVAWPSIAIISTEFGFEKEFLKSAVVQATVTGIAGAAFAVYNNYKKRQMYVENLMRVVIFSPDDSIKSLINKVLKEMERIDHGFSFSESATKKQLEDNT